MATKSKFLAKHGLAYNTTSGSTATINFPAADGTADQLLKTDGAGNLSFTTLAQNFLGLSDTPSSFSASDVGKTLVVNSSNDGLEISNLTVANSQNRQEFTGDGATTAFTLTTTFAGANYIMVFVDGVIQTSPTNYGLSGTTLTFTTAPQHGADILVFGTIPIAGIIDVGTLLPDTTNVRDLGSSSKRWDELYVRDINASQNVTISGTLNTHTIPGGTDTIVVRGGLSVGTPASASGSGGIAYNNSTAVFTYTPPDLSTYIQNSDTDVIKDTHIDFGTASGQVSTDDLPEGSTNLYYTDTRVDTRIGNLGINSLSDVDTTGVANNSILKYDNSSSKFVIATDVDTGITSVLADTTPQLGGDLDLNEKNITGTGTYQAGVIADAYISSAATWNAKQAALTFGIADTNSVVINSATVADDDYAKFTATGLEGRSATEVKTDLSLNNVENTAISTFAGSSNITTVGTIGSGVWQGTAIADAYLASGSTFMKNLADDTTPELGGILNLNRNSILESTIDTNSTGKGVDTSNTSTNIDFDVENGSVKFFSVNQDHDRNLNFRGNVSTTLDSLMATGDVMSAAIVWNNTSNSSGPHKIGNILVDGTSSGVTTEYQGGTQPTGTASSYDLYHFSIFKTASSTYVVFVNSTDFS